AKLFGGATMHGSLGAIGRANGEFALRFLATEGIPCVSQSLGGTRGRSIRYWPVNGRAQMRFLADYDPQPVEAPMSTQASNQDDVTIF
ncbi:chemotaxis protein CheD, partial [Thioclava sp. BHET1]